MCTVGCKTLLHFSREIVGNEQSDHNNVITYSKLKLQRSLQRKIGHVLFCLLNGCLKTLKNDRILRTVYEWLTTLKVSQSYCLDGNVVVVTLAFCWVCSCAILFSFLGNGLNCPVRCLKFEIWFYNLSPLLQPAPQFPPWRFCCVPWSSCWCLFSSVL